VFLLKRIFALVVFLAVAVIFIPWLNPKSVANQNYNVTVFVAGEQVNFPDQKPYIDEAKERTYVPVRFVSEALGATVNWDSVLQAVYIEKPQLKVVLTIGSNEAVVNSVKKTLDAPAVLVGDRTMVPLRFVSEALGEEVKWTPGGSGGRVDIRLPAGVVPVVPEERPEVVQLVNSVLGGDYVNKGYNGWPDEWGADVNGVRYTFDIGEAGNMARDINGSLYIDQRIWDHVRISYFISKAPQEELSKIRTIVENYLPEHTDKIMETIEIKEAFLQQAAGNVEPEWFYSETGNYGYVNSWNSNSWTDKDGAFVCIQINLLRK